ncbi:MAG: HRDC domain-containing protein [Frankia sp.]
MTSTLPDEKTEARQVQLLLTPAEGVPPVIVDASGLTAAVNRLAAGTGPVAFDAERASGYRYSQRAYLVQIRRRGSGSLLIDPIELPDLRELQAVVADAEWVLHAASQDLPCLAELGLRPSTLFDTELAGRLLGYERVGLGAMVERVLGFGLEKGHSAADWSTRPLPEPWLRYAALDVELLVELRDVLAEELARDGKLAWAQEEFAAIAAAPPREPRAEPWRRTSGIHRMRSRRHLAAVREMWETRDRIARTRDIAPGRILPDAAIIDAVTTGPVDAAALAKLPVFSGPKLRKSATTWWDALARAAALAEGDLPLTATGNPDGLPPPSRWAERDPAAAGRLARARAALTALAADHTMPVENLLEPAITRRLAWSPPKTLDLETVTAVLRADGARDWQIDLAAATLAAALVEPPPAPVAATPVAPSAPTAPAATTATSAPATAIEASTDSPPNA